MANRPTDARSDLYSLGATLYVLLTAVPPADARVRQQVRQHGVPDPLRPANEVNPQVPPRVAEILAKAMALNPANRPPDCRSDATHVRVSLDSACERV